MRANALSLNVNKTYYMLFSNTRTVPPSGLQIILDGMNVRRKQNYKFLGINVKTKLNLKFLISHVCGKIARYVGIFYRLLYYFPRKILVNFYYSLVYPYLLYCVISWGGGTYPSCLAPLKLLQKRIVRLLAGNHYLGHSEPLFARLKILRVDDINRFVLARICSTIEGV